MKSRCAVKGFGELGERSGREGKNRPKESYFSNSFNTTTLKAKHGPCQRMNQLDTDTYLKGKPPFSIPQEISVRVFVCKYYCKCPLFTKRVPVQGGNIIHFLNKQLEQGFYISEH